MSVLEKFKLVELITTRTDAVATSVEALTAKNVVLNKQIEAQKSKVETLRKALSNAATSFGETDRRTKQWQIQLNNAEAALNAMERELDENANTINSSSEDWRHGCGIRCPDGSVGSGTAFATSSESILLRMRWRGLVKCWSRGCLAPLKTTAMKR